MTAAKKPLLQHDFPGGCSHILVRLSQNRFPIICWGGSEQGGIPTRPADPVQEGPPTSVQETPKGPAWQLRMLSLSLCDMRASAVFLEGTEELACFFFFFFLSRIISEISDFRVKRED